MPVIECSCGMMMSVPAAEPRSCCIRCGGVEFRLVEKWDPARATRGEFALRPPRADCAQSPLDLTTIGLAVAEPVGEGAYI
jgi:hypothetical protein